MTLEESVKQQIKIMQAFIDGKDVQFREKATLAMIGVIILMTDGLLIFSNTE